MKQAPPGSRIMTRRGSPSGTVQAPTPRRPFTPWRSRWTRLQRRPRRLRPDGRPSPSSFLVAAAPPPPAISAYFTSGEISSPAPRSNSSDRALRQRLDRSAGTDDESIRGALDEAVAAFGGIDVPVNNADIGHSAVEPDDDEDMESRTGFA